MDLSENTTKSPRAWVIANLSWGLAYLVASLIGLELSVPPSSISPIWPAAGVALAGLLVHNLRVLPGLIIGCYVVQFVAFGDTSTTESIVRSLIIGLSTTAGSILQAMLANHLLRRYLSWPLTLSRGREVVRFYLYSALLACTVAPTLGVTSLYLGGALDQLHIVNVWLTWWIGDALGTMIATPLLLAFVGRPAQYWRSRRLPLGLPLLLTMLLVGVFFLFSVQQSNHRIEMEFSGASYATLNEAASLIADHQRAPEGTALPIQRLRKIIDSRLPDDAGLELRLEDPDGNAHVLYQRDVAPATHDVTFGLPPPGHGADQGA